VGLDNFKRFFAYPQTGQIVYNTLFIAIAKLLLGLAVPVLFALLLNEVRYKKFNSLLQTIAYLPNFLSWVILGGIFVNILSPSNGIVNGAIKLFGGEPVYFLGSNATFPWTLIATDVWKNFGYASIVYLAALTAIDPALYEAASVDGASRLRQVFTVTLPGILPIVFVMAVLSLGSVLNAGFDQVFNLYSPQVYASGDILDTFIYRMGLENAQYGFSTAISFMKSVISFLLIALAYFLADRFGDYRVF
jgi:putative aldouronate transport system permease protein